MKFMENAEMTGMTEPLQFVWMITVLLWVYSYCSLYNSLQYGLGVSLLILLARYNPKVERVIKFCSNIGTFACKLIAMGQIVLKLAGK